MNIVITGFGTVGQNLVQLLLKNGEFLKKAYGMVTKIVAIVDSKGAAISQRGLDLNLVLKYKREHGTVAKVPSVGYEMSFLEVVRNVEADVLVEATHTNLVDGEPGMTHIVNALQHSLNVVTVNKGPLALAMPMLKEMAEHRKLVLKFSGTVGGGLPVLAFAKECAKGDKVVKIEGILNGTTNYVLTRMEDGLKFEEALLEAQEKGYAERDPTLDISGMDTACKLVILTNEVLGKKVTLRDVKVEGITDVKPEDIKTAKNIGKTIRLIGVAEDSGVFVKPLLVNQSDPLAVRYAYNAITLTLENSGRHTITGKGAGGIETATAIIRDLLSIKERLVIT
ncbi:MAG: homoserine dehydrogenase [Nitrososphaerota archaeon]|nr:homoserine dehydrogenase [Aigarchaeota archaeon]MDW8077190.1 homoserine dehydrogenase [Nitrososphaerota archaeon]